MLIYGLQENHEIITAETEQKKGKATRNQIPFSDHAVFYLVERDPVRLVESENINRVQELLSLRKERMSASPFTFYRGSAILMANDLSRQAVTGYHAVICGDAHLNNFGFYASPERRLVFDLNDFDEAAPGSWEWDLKRLVTSVILGGEELGFQKDQIKEAALNTAMMYRIGLRYMLKKSSLDRYYTRLDEEGILKSVSKEGQATFKKVAEKAKKSNSEKVIARLTKIDSQGRRVFIENPPVLTKLKPELVTLIAGYYKEYLKTVRSDIALLLSQHTLTDITRRVVGVGSVGSNCFLLALTSNNGSHIVLQIKEASQSVISMFNQKQFLDTDPQMNKLGQGFRVAKYQQILQAVSDPFLGHFKSKDGRDYYVRQFRDMKGSYEMNTLSYNGYMHYGAACSYLLARAHSQSPQSGFIAGYLGKSEKFDHAIVSWCHSYSKQVYQDYEQYIK